MHWTQTPKKCSTSKNVGEKKAWWCQHLGFLAIPSSGRTLDLLQVIWELINKPEHGLSNQTKIQKPVEVRK